MAFTPGYDGRVLVDHIHAATHIRDTTITDARDMLEVTVLTTAPARSYISGQQSSTFEFSGPLDTDGTDGGPFDTYAVDNLGATNPVPVSYAPVGWATQGNPVGLVDTHEASFQITSGVASTVDYTFSGQTTGLLDWGVSLQDLTAITVDDNGTAYDGGAASTNGGVAHLHVTAFSGLDSDDITIEASADGSTGWATVVTFTQVTGTTSERVAITGSVARYLRVVHDVTGTGSITSQVSFARR